MKDLNLTVAFNTMIDKKILKGKKFPFCLPGDRAGDFVVYLSRDTAIYSAVTNFMPQVLPESRRYPTEEEKQLYLKYWKLNKL